MKKMQKKTRNVISGILVGIASIFAVISFAEIPANEVGRFLLSTAILIVVIVLLALLAVCAFKLLGWLKKQVFRSKDNPQSTTESTIQSSGDNVERE